MSESPGQFSAAASAAGYLYQARLALLLCIPHLNAGSEIEVAIERFDDISFEGQGQPKELLQTKHKINRVGNLSDSSADLWKTLRIWSEAAAADPSMPSRTKLALLTTGEAPAGSAADLLRPFSVSKAKKARDPKTAAEILTSVASSSKNEALKPAFDAFLQLPERMRASLLSAIEIVDRQPLLSDLDAELENSLRLVAPPGKAGLAREMLEGWWWPRICSALTASGVQSIPIGAIEAKLDDIRDMLKRDALVANYEHAEPSPEEAAEYDEFRFVKQLRAVGIGGNRVGFAKRDYYRAFVQRSKWTRENVVLDEELEKFERLLIEEWEPRYAAMCDAHEGKEEDEAQLCADGREIYQWVETEARFPFRSLTAKFLNVGSYHILANDLRVGWHRDYKKLRVEDD
ncbi:ABC-three component system protein [Ensifer adhaerens]|uniref:ABC-three component system protein n=1 Tax=Ensifer adhaerens TaxID=106592 RepID=UPI003CFC5325